MPPASLALLFLLHTHSLRCGLKEYRQLRWLRSMFALSCLIEFYLCSRQYLEIRVQMQGP